MYEIINDKLNEKYNFSHFMSDVRFITTLKKDLVTEKDHICDAENCYVLDRAELTNDTRGNNLYFVNNSNNDNEEITNNICVQQILDSIHSFVYHSLHLNVSDIELKEKENDEKEDNIDLSNICVDTYTDKVINLLQNERNKSTRYRTRRRTNNDDNETGGIYSKFITTNKYKISSLVSINGKSKQKCFMDVVLIALKQNKFPDVQQLSLKNLLLSEEYDSDSICQDLEDKQQSNLNLSDAFYQILRKLIIERQIRHILYSPGYRYFYWNFYKNNTQKANAVFTYGGGKYSHYEENPGYKLNDWYIPVKYASLKEELLSNKVAAFTLQQFNNTLFKAQYKLQAWIDDETVENIVCTAGWPAKVYNISRGDAVSVQHILSILLYTNFSKQCYLFSETYRKIGEYESDKDLKLRHQEVANWGKLIRETVEAFGTAMGDAKSYINTFYHGIGATLIFDSSSIKLCGPV
eukprot:481588_1